MVFEENLGFFLVFFFKKSESCKIEIVVENGKWVIRSFDCDQSLGLRSFVCDGTQ